MPGELRAVWPACWKEIWSPLLRHQEYGDDLAIDLYREHVPVPRTSAPATDLTSEELDGLEERIREYEESANSPVKARKSLQRRFFLGPISEQDACKFLERSFRVFENYDDQNFSNSYFIRLERFLDKYNVRYDLRRPLTLHPNLPGIFSSLIRELHKVTTSDAHLAQLMGEFEEALRDLKEDCSQGRVKTCIQKQFNLLEAIAGNFPGVTQHTLGDICSQINSWPHLTIREALRKLYGFRSDYPGLGHAGNPAGVVRALDVRDMVAIGVMLVGFVPYLSSTLDAGAAYGQ